MEKEFTIFEDGIGNVKFFSYPEDSFMSIDYHQKTGTNTFIDGNFSFDDEEELYKSFDVTDFEGLCNVLKTKFENKNIDINIDESEGFGDDSNFFISNF